MTAVGYGDLSAVSDNEKLYCIFIMMISCGVFAYLVGHVSSIIIRSNTIMRDFKYNLFPNDSF